MEIDLGCPEDLGKFNSIRTSLRQNCISYVRNEIKLEANWIFSNPYSDYILPIYIEYAYLSLYSYKKGILATKELRTSSQYPVSKVLQSAVLWIAFIRLCGQPTALSDSGGS